MYWTKHENTHYSLDPTNSTVTTLTGTLIETFPVDVHRSPSKTVLSGNNFYAELPSNVGENVHIQTDSKTFYSRLNGKPHTTRRRALDQIVKSTSPLLNVSMSVYDHITGLMSNHKKSDIQDNRQATASSRKLSLLAEVMRQAQQGIVDLSSNIVVTDDDVANGSTKIGDMSLPETFTLHDLVERMIKDSDNTATYIISNLVGLENVNNLLKVLTLNSYTSGFALGLRKDSEPYYSDGWRSTLDYYEKMSYTTPEDMNMLTAWLYSGLVLDAQHSAMVKEIMAMPRDTNRALGGVPPTVPYYGKPGSISGTTKQRPTQDFEVQPGVAADTCTFEFGSAVYSVTIMVEGDNALGSATVRELSAAVSDYFAGGAISGGSVLLS